VFVAAVLAYLDTLAAAGVDVGDARVRVSEVIITRTSSVSTRRRLAEGDSVFTVTFVFEVSNVPTTVADEVPACA
jgi:hypothetical protein